MAGMNTDLLIQLAASPLIRTASHNPGTEPDALDEFPDSQKTFGYSNRER